MSELGALGFDSSELFACNTDEHARPFWTPDWLGESLYLAVRPASRLDLSLTSVGADSELFPKIREEADTDVHEAPPVQILGRERDAGEVTVFPTTMDGNVAGTIGSPCFRGGCLGYDPAGRRLGFHPGSHSHDAHRGAIHLLGVGDRSVPLTTSLRFKEAPDVPLVALICFGTERSGATKALVDRLPKGLVAEDSWAEFATPSGWSLRAPGLKTIEPTRYAVDLGVESIDLVLGIDVLRSGTAVFDYATGAVHLYPYRSAS